MEYQDIEDETYVELNKIIGEIEKNRVTRKNEGIKENREQEEAKKENLKIPKAKALLEEYREALRKKDEEIASLKASNEQLYASIKKVPKFIRKIFMKEKAVQLLNK